MSWQGRLKLNADESDVVSVDGPLRIAERRDGVLRSWTVTPQPDGSLKREYRVGDQPQALDAEGQLWLKRMLTKAAEVGLSPQQRAERRLAQGGVPALLADIDAADGDFTKRQRIEGALSVLPAAQQRDGAIVQALLQRASTMDSAFERRNTLQALAPHLLVADQPALLAAAQSMDSDFERAQLLSDLAPRLAADAATQAAWLQAARAIDNDFERRRAIEAQLRQAQGDWRATLLEASSGMDSAFEQRHALDAVLGRLDGSDTALRLRLLTLSMQVQSDHEASSLLQDVMKTEGQSPEVLAAVLARAGHIDGSHERLQVLLAVAPQLPANCKWLTAAPRAACPRTSAARRSRRWIAEDRSEARPEADADQQRVDLQLADFVAVALDVGAELDLLHIDVEQPAAAHRDVEAGAHGQAEAAAAGRGVQRLLHGRHELHRREEGRVHARPT